MFRGVQIIGCMESFRTITIGLLYLLDRLPVSPTCFLSALIYPVTTW